MDFAGAVAQAINSWIGVLGSSALSPALNAAGHLVLDTPRFDSIPEFQQAWSVVRGITDAAYVLAVLAAGIMVMSSGAFESSYRAKRLLPRLILGGILSNSSLAICGQLTQIANALVGALISIPGGGWGHIAASVAGSVATSTPATALVALAAAVIAVLLVVVFIIRDLVLLVATVVAPLAIATYCLPQTEEIARIWLRVYLAGLLVQVLEAIVIATGVELLANTQWIGVQSPLVSSLGLVTLLYLLVRLPLLSYRWAFGHPVSQSPIVRTAIIAGRAIATGA